MKTTSGYDRVLISIILAWILSACSTGAAIPTPSVTPSPTPSPFPTISPSPTPIYQSAFGIDYAHPATYLAPGLQSRISDPSQIDELRQDEQSLFHLQTIFRWMKDNFELYSARGQTIGIVTVDDLFASRRLGGCHDVGLVYSAILRELGYPAVLVSTDSIAWIEQFQAGESDIRIGHIFVEVYLDERWVLIDPTNGWYVIEGYDPTNPVIPLEGHIAGSSEEIYGFYVECKGVDIWDLGFHSPDESFQAMDAFAAQLDLSRITYPEYLFRNFDR